MQLAGKKKFIVMEIVAGAPLPSWLSCPYARLALLP
jgi:hypothetical protein